MKARTLSRSRTNQNVRKGWSNIATGIMWTKASIHQPISTYPFRHDTAQDELARFEWLRHDGKHFGIEQLLDTSYRLNMTASFIVPGAQSLDKDKASCVGEKGECTPEMDSPSNNNLVWLQRFAALDDTPADINTGERKCLVFYLGNADTISREDDDGGRLHVMNVSVLHSDKVSSAVSVSGFSEATGRFSLFLHFTHDNHTSSSPSPVTPAVSFFGTSGRDVLSEVERLKSAIGHGSFSDVFDAAGSFSNELEKDSNFVGIQVRFDRSLSLRSVYFEDTSPSSMDELAEDRSPFSLIQSALRDPLRSEDVQKVVDEIDHVEEQLFRRYQHAFDARFSRMFAPNLLNKFSATELEVAKRAVSAVLGGIGYFQGFPRISAGVDDVAVLDPEQGLMLQSPEAISKKSSKTRIPAAENNLLTLLTGTPSRTSFPRGMLACISFPAILVHLFPFLF